ncbi:MAG TPA: PilN domain-containing protein [Burkholderiales bacterium]|nr:PilN domain-containing protein [Burkholderiales bacterium]
MTQQINLYNAALEKKRELLSLPGLVIVWGCAVLLVALAAALASLRVSALGAELQKEAAARTAAQTELSRLSAQVGSRQRDPALAAAAARLEAELAGRQEVMRTLRGGIIGNTDGFSEYMRAFARQSFEGVWLTRFRLAGAGQDVVLEGRALSPELVPDYVQRLNREAMLKGHAFAELQMQRPAAETGEAPPYIEFRLATMPSATGRGEQP